MGQRNDPRRQLFASATLRRVQVRPENRRPAPWLRSGTGTATGPATPPPDEAFLEALLMSATEPVPLRQAAAILHWSEPHLSHVIAVLKHVLLTEQSAYEVVTVAEGLQLRTRAIYHSWLARRPSGTNRAGPAASSALTSTMLETLAIVAYKQPTPRAEIDGVRGVHSREVLRQLLERGLIKVVGREDSLGRPQLYGTTPRFLKLFGLNTLAELPQVVALPRPGQQPPSADGA
ncbi:MAG: SMC-Scp complex subunit ScpB [Gemmataceae bacterium]